jgi:anti-sigma B factor antagonist
VTLSLTSNRDGNTVTIAITGDLDLSTSDDLEQQIVAHAREDGVSTVVVDLAGVAFVDSAGINALLRARRWADDHQRSLRVVGATGLVHEVLQLTGVLAHLTDTGP